MQIYKRQKESLINCDKTYKYTFTPKSCYHNKIKKSRANSLFVDFKKNIIK